MKKIYTTLFLLAALLVGQTVNATVLFPVGGGTGTSTIPTYGQVLVGNANGTYTPTATSSLGITGGGSGSGTVNSGTQGQVGYYAANGTAISGTSSIFIIASSSVGIGTTSPKKQFSVQGDQMLTGSLFGATNTQVFDVTGRKLYGPIPGYVAFDFSVGDDYRLNNGDLGITSNAINFRTPGAGWLRNSSNQIVLDVSKNQLIPPGIDFATVPSLDWSDPAVLVVGHNNTSGLPTFYEGPKLKLINSAVDVDGNNIGQQDSGEGTSNWRWRSSSGLNYFNNSGFTGNGSGLASLNAGNISTGVLAIARGGTGTATAPTQGKVLVGNAGGTYDLTSTSSLGFLTTNVAEGTNLYYTDARVSNYVSASTSIARGTPTNGNVLLGNGTNWVSVATSSLGITGGGGGSGTVGSGIAGQTPYYSANGTAIAGTSTILVGTTSGRYGNVGIGKQPTTARLEVQGNSIFNGALQVSGSDINVSNHSDGLVISDGNVGSTLESGIYSNNSGQAIAALDIGTNIYAYGDHAVEYDSGNDIFRIPGTATKVGIGTTSPTAPLHIRANRGSMINFTDNTARQTAGIGLTTPNGGGPDLAVGYGADRVVVGDPSGSTYAMRVLTQTVEWVNGMNWTANGGTFNVQAINGMYFQSNNNNTKWFEADKTNYTRISGYNTGGTSYLPVVLQPDGGNVGIGTSSPYSKLSVAGQVVADNFVATTSATSTLPSLATTNLALGSKLYDNAGSPGVSGYVLQATSSGARWVATSTLGITGGSSLTGSTGQVAYFSGANAAVGTSSIFISAAGNVGIGTAAPSAKLHVSTTGGAAIANFQDTGTGNSWITVGNSALLTTFGALDAATSYFYTSGNLDYYANSAQRLRLSSAGSFAFGSTYYAANPGFNNAIFEGNVGIGTTSPFAKLSVAGLIAGQNFMATSLATSTLPNLSSSNLALSGRLFDSLGSAGTSGNVLQTTGSATQWVSTSSLGISGGSSLAGTAGQIAYFSGTNNAVGTSTIFIASNSTAVGILNASPQAPLDVGGKLRLFSNSGTAGTSDAAYSFNTGSIPSGSLTEATGQILSYAINTSQIGTRDTSKAGGIFRLDTRTTGSGTYGGDQSFIVFGSPTGGSSFLNRLAVNLQTGETLLAADGGNVGIGSFNPSSKLVVGGNVLADSFMGTSTTATSSFLMASTTKISVKQLFDSAGSPGTVNSVLRSNGTNALWTATSSLGLVNVNAGTTGQYASTYFTLTDGATVPIDFNNGNNQKVTIAASRTITFANPLSGGNYTIEIAQGGTGSNTITWPTVKWQGGVAPTLSTTVGKKDVIVCKYDAVDYLCQASLNF